MNAQSKKPLLGALISVALCCFLFQQPSLIRTSQKVAEANEDGRQLFAVMENASLPSDVWNDLTTSSPEDHPSLYVFRFDVGHIIMGTVGVLDNLFVIITFALFITIADKVCDDFQ